MSAGCTATRRDQIVADLVAAEDAIAEATGERPLGFRGPGFSWSPQLLEVLAERGYLYDASTLPTYLGPLARAYFLATARISTEQRRQREDLFGSFRDGLAPGWGVPVAARLRAAATGDPSHHDAAGKDCHST